MTSRLDQYRNRFEREPIDYRPSSATVAAVLLVIIGGLGVLLGTSIVGESDAEGGALAVLVAASLGVPAAEAIGGIGVWIGRRWGRWLAIAGCGLNLLASVIFLFGGAAPLQGLIGCVVYVALILQLCLDTVIRWCR